MFSKVTPQLTTKQMQQSRLLNRWKPRVKLALIPVSFAIAGLALVTERANANVAINKSFNPINVVTNQPSTLTIELANSNPSSANNTTFSDNLPAGVVIAPSPNLTNSCSGTVTATAGSGVVTLTNGTIPRQVGGVIGRCQISVDVIAPAPNTYVNQIPVNTVNSSLGSNPDSADATLLVTSATPVTGTKSFSPNNVHGNGSPTTMTITLNNSNAFGLTNTTFTDPLPGGLRVAATPAASTTCVGGTVSATPGSTSVSLSGGTIPGSGSCTVAVRLEASNPNTYQDQTVTNSIPANDLKTTQGVTNASAIEGQVRVQRGASVSKSFSPGAIAVGGTSVLTLTLSNFNSTAITAASIIDNMPAGVTVTSLAGNTCNGTATFTAAQVRLSDGTIPAAPPGAGAGSCQISVNVTAATAGSYNNTITAGDLNGVNYSATSATLIVNTVFVSKSFSPNAVPQGTQSTLTINLVNSSTTPANITAFTDDLTKMGTGFTVAASPAATTTCGGTVTATPGSTSITKNDGTIPANGSCTIVVPIAVAINAINGNRTNTIEVNGLQTSAGNNVTTSTANLNVQRAVTLAKAFSPTTVLINGVSRLTITISRPATGLPLTGIGVTDPLPSGHTVNTTPNITNTCGGTVNATAGASSITLTGGSLNPTTSCQVIVDVKAPGTAGSATNTIAANTLVTTQGATYNTTATATLNRISSFLSLNKAFTPNSIAFGGSSTLSVLIVNSNPNAINLTNAALTDLFPAGMTVANPPSSSFTGAGCSGGTVTAPPGSNQVSISGASINANSVCTLSVRVTSNFAGNLTNIIPANTATSTQGVTNTNQPSATLTLLGVSDLELVSKSNGVSSLAPGAGTAYTIVIRNNGPDNVAGVSVTDFAPPGMTINSWTCSTTVGSACSAASGTGDLNTTISLANQETATFMVNATINSSTTGSITNTAQVKPPPTVTDPDTSNNTAEDTDTIAATTAPNVLLVKRITAINGSTTTIDGDSLALYKDEPSNPYDDDTLDSPAPNPVDTDKWMNPSTFLIGGTKGGNIQPGDEIEYTIYFLSAGTATANNVLFCDLVPQNVTFVPTAFNGFATKATGGLPNSDRGIQWLYNGQTESLTNASDGDAAQYFPPNSDPTRTYPTVNCAGANTNGAIVVNLGNLPNATAPGTPTKSHGFVRFRGRVK
jgi:uncharacterized repeat protein (TIGR01451 family)